MLDKLNLTDPIALVVAIVIVFFIVSETITGYKRGFLESGIKLLGSIVAFVGAYILKNPISVLMYTHLPFFKLGGAFKGVDAISIVIYELIAFALVFVVLMLVLNIINEIFKLTDKLLKVVMLIGLPNKILGAILGFIQGMIILYFVIAVFKIGVNVFSFDMRASLADYVVEMPILKDTFGPTIDSLEEITSLAKDYEHTQDKEEFNNKAIDILLKNDIITKENLDVLIESGKVKYTEVTE